MLGAIFTTILEHGFTNIFLIHVYHIDYQFFNKKQFGESYLLLLKYVLIKCYAT